MSPTTVVVGSSVGGVRTAQALRTAGYDGDVVLVGEESALPYDKPPLSKAMLAGATTFEAITLLTEQAAADAGIRLLLGRRAVQLHVDEQAVELDGGERLAYDDVVIATGARARPSPWGEPPGVHVLRTLDDAIALSADLRRGGPLVVIGAGFVGAEVAATARGMGVEAVTVVDPVPVPLSRVLNPAVAQRFATLHADRGVDTRFGVGVAAIDGVPGGLAVRLTDGVTLPAAVVVVGIGAVPNDDWLRVIGAADRRRRGVRRVQPRGRGTARARGRRRRALVPPDGTGASCASSTGPTPWSRPPASPTTSSTRTRRAPTSRSSTSGATSTTGRSSWPGARAGTSTTSRCRARIPSGRFAVLYADPDGGFAGAVTVNWPRALVACRRLLGAASTLEEVRGSVEGLVKRAPTAARG